MAFEKERFTNLDYYWIICRRNCRSLSRITLESRRENDKWKLHNHKIQKQNFVDKATSFIGMATYGQIMIGDKAFEFYNSKNPKDYIQIPWNEVDLIIASVYFKGRWIPRFAIQTKQNGIFPFAARHPKAVLRACRETYQC